MQVLRYIRFVVFFCVLAVFCGTGPARAQEGPAVTAESAILIEASTGRVIYEKDADALRYPASTTKMMTCILALEKGNMDAVITVSPAAANVEDTELQAGDQMKLAELVQEMMLRSDNGAAVAIEEYLASSMGSFAEQMNKKAVSLGARNTQFLNPNGLPNPQHYSTARDIAKIAAYGMKNPEFRALVGVKTKNIHWLRPAGKSAVMENTNALLGVYPGLTGIKTGYTKAAGGCLAASAQRDGLELIAVVLHSESEAARFRDAAALLDYGFAQMRLVPGLERTQAVRGVWVRGGQKGRITARPAADLLYPVLQEDEVKRYTVAYDIPIAEAGVKAGQQVGELVLSYDGHEVERIPLLADEDSAAGFSLLGFLIRLFT